MLYHVMKCIQSFEKSDHNLVSCGHIAPFYLCIIIFINKFSCVLVKLDITVSFHFPLLYFLGLSL